MSNKTRVGFANAILSTKEIDSFSVSTIDGSEIGVDDMIVLNASNGSNNFIHIFNKSQLDQLRVLLNIAEDNLEWV